MTDEILNSMKEKNSQGTQLDSSSQGLLEHISTQKINLLNQ